MIYLGSEMVFDVPKISLSLMLGMFKYTVFQSLLVEDRNKLKIYFKRGRKLPQCAAEVYFKIEHLFQMGAKVISNWGSYFKVKKLYQNGASYF